MPLDNKEALESVIGTLALEGLTLSDDMIENVRDIIAGRRDAEDVVAEIKAQCEAEKKKPR